MRAQLTSAALLCAMLQAQNPNTAIFPAGVATDNDLLVASNNARSTLSGAIGSTDTSLTLADASRFTAPLAVSIEGEVIRCTARTGNTLASCTRGFDGSTASPHPINATVQGNLIDRHFNQTAAEIKSIEAILSHMVIGAQPTTYLSANSASPSILPNVSRYLTHNTAATSISSFQGCTAGQLFTVVIGDSFTSFSNSTGGVTFNAATPFTTAPGDAYSFVCAATASGTATTNLLISAPSSLSGTSGTAPSSIGMTRTLNMPMAGYNLNASGIYWGGQNASGGMQGFGNYGLGTISQFPHTGTPQLVFQFRWPADWDNTAAPSIQISDTQISGSSGNYQFDFSVACMPAGTSWNPTFNSVLSTGPLGMPSNAQITEATLTGLVTTGCAPGTLSYLKAARNNTITGNSASDDLGLLNVALIYTAK